MVAATYSFGYDDSVLVNCRDFLDQLVCSSRKRQSRPVEALRLEFPIDTNDRNDDVRLPSKRHGTGDQVIRVFDNRTAKADAGIGIHDDLILIAVGWATNVAEDELDLVLRVSLEGTYAALFNSCRAKECLATFLAGPIVNHEFVVDVQLLASRCQHTCNCEQRRGFSYLGSSSDA